MKLDIYLGVINGVMALVSIGGVLSPRFRSLVFRSLPVSRMTCGLLFLLSGEAFISELRLIDADKIYRSIQIATVILFVISIAADFYLAKNRSKKHWLVFGAAIILGCLITMAYLSARTRGRARDTSLPPNSALANRRPARQSDGSENFLRDHCNRSASRAAVVELGRLCTP